MTSISGRPERLYVGSSNYHHTAMFSLCFDANEQ